MSVERLRIGRRIRAKRVELGWSRQEFAEVTGLKIGTVERIEVGARYPSADHIMMICDAVSISPNYVVFGVEDFFSRVDPSVSKRRKVDRLIQDIEDLFRESGDCYE